MMRSFSMSFFGFAVDRWGAMGLAVTVAHSRSFSHRVGDVRLQGVPSLSRPLCSGFVPC